MQLLERRRGQRYSQETRKWELPEQKCSGTDFPRITALLVWSGTSCFQILLRKVEMKRKWANTSATSQNDDCMKDGRDVEYFMVNVLVPRYRKVVHESFAM
jgi:hypothetical protein